MKRDLITLSASLCLSVTSWVKLIKWTRQALLPVSLNRFFQYHSLIVYAKEIWSFLSQNSKITLLPPIFLSFDYHTWKRNVIHTGSKHLYTHCTIVLYFSSPSEKRQSTPHIFVASINSWLCEMLFVYNLGYYKIHIKGSLKAHGLFGNKAPWFCS